MKSLLIFTLLLAVTATSAKLVGRNNNSFARSLVSDGDNVKINCTYPKSPTACVCPYTCFEQFEKTYYCVAKKCYSYDENLGRCEAAGTDHIGPLVLQAIPVTGIFGAGFGNMGRWDLFGIYMAVLFGGCLFICITVGMCFCCPCFNNLDDQEIGPNDTCGHAVGTCWSSCGSCLYGTTVLVFYILGIVWTATPGMVLDPNGCPLKF